MGFFGSFTVALRNIYLFQGNYLVVLELYKHFVLSFVVGTDENDAYFFESLNDNWRIRNFAKHRENQFTGETHPRV